MHLPQDVLITEVGPRDGFQVEAWIPTHVKVEIIDALSHTGLRRIEATSFVHPRAIPQMADAEEVMARITRIPGVTYRVLVPNLHGARRAVEARAGEIVFVVSCTETHNRKNVNRSVEDSLTEVEQALRLLEGTGVTLTPALAVAFGCPYEGDTPPERVMSLVARLAAMGVHEVALADTIGVAHPRQVYDVLRAVGDRWPDLPLSLHLHDNWGRGLANALAAMQAGVCSLDAGIGGTGGSPFTPGSMGNVSTEDLVAMCEGLGVRTGVDRDRLAACARTVEEIVGRLLPSHSLRALAAQAKGQGG